MEVFHSRSNQATGTITFPSHSPPLQDSSLTQPLLLPLSKPPTKRFKYFQFLAFILTALLYSLSHALRTSWGYVKPELVNTDSYYTSKKLGYLDFAFTLSYALGQYVNGWLGDRVNLKAFLFCGTLISIGGMCLFGYLEGMVYLNSLAIDILLFVVNGLGQSTGYPSCVSIVSNWYSAKKAGLVFGIWGTNQNIGNIIGQQIGRITVDVEGHPWQYALFVTSAVLISVLMCLMIFVKVSPNDINKTNPRLEEQFVGGSSIQAQDDRNSILHAASQKVRAIGFLEAWKIKNVPYFALGIFCVKGVMYGVMFWLPYYLVNEAQLEGDVSYILASIEIGMISGSVILGFLSDRIRSRSIMIAFGFFFAVIFLLMTCLIKGMQLKMLYFILLLLAGIGIGGPSSLIGGAVSSDLGRQIAENSATSATSTVTGIMEGCGALGAATSQIVISNFTGITFPFFAALCFMGGLLMMPIAWRDARRLRRERELRRIAPPAEII